MRTDPTVFDQSTQGTVRLRRDDLPADHAEALTEAAALCPGRAITVR
ncbi:ferredoxin [Micromonospora wenchangensis]|nr:ferredoxin [Micromonospora wenchangensis]